MNLKVVNIFQVALLIMALTVCTRAGAADPQTLKVMCAGCHGNNGVSLTENVPTIAGQPYTLIEDSLLSYRDGLRFCGEDGASGVPPSPMCAIAATLDDGAIALLAGYYEQQTFKPAKQAYDETTAQRGAALHHRSNCESCHSGGGTISNGMAAILAGQWTPYLDYAFRQIRAGERLGPKMMNAEIDKFSDEEVQALLSFYASRGR